jgi:hypothetical protein
VVFQVTPEDDSFYGEYRCLAENKHGKAEHLITLKQAHVPQPPTQATFQTVTGKSSLFKHNAFAFYFEIQAFPRFPSVKIIFVIFAARSQDNYICIAIFLRIFL